MQTWNTTQAQSVFGAFSSSYTSSYSDADSEDSASWGGGASYGTTSSGDSYTYSSSSTYSAIGTALQSTSGDVYTTVTVTAAQTYSFSETGNLTNQAGTNYAQGANNAPPYVPYEEYAIFETTSYNNQTSTSYTVTANYAVTTTATQEWDYTTTTTYQTTQSEYTSSSTSTTAYSSTSTFSTSTYTTATTSANVIVTDTQMPYPYDSSYSTGYFFFPNSSSSQITVTQFSYSIISISSPIEYGTIVSADTDWLWAITTPTTDYDSNSYVISQIGDSFTESTFWPTLFTSACSILDGNGATYSIDASTTAFTATAYWMNAVDEDFNPITYASTTTTGDEFPRVTTSTSFNSTTFSTYSFTDGIASASASVAGTIATTFSSNVRSTTGSTILIPVQNNSTTTTIGVSTMVQSTYSCATNAFNAPFVALSYSSQRGVFGSTQCITVGETYAQATYANGKTFQQVPGQGGFMAPDSMQQGDNVGANLSVDSPIYYPFVSSVQQNVVVPVPSNTSVYQSYDASNNYQTNVTSWNYQWSFPTVSYTSATSQSSSYTFGPATASSSSTYAEWSSTSSTAQFEVESVMDVAYWQNAGPVLGGYSPVSSASEFAELLGGVIGTNYDSTGGTTSDSTIRSSIEVSSLWGTARVEQQEPVFITGTLNVYNNDIYNPLPVVTFTR